MALILVKDKLRSFGMLARNAPHSKTPSGDEDQAIDHGFREAIQLRGLRLPMH